MRLSASGSFPNLRRYGSARKAAASVFFALIVMTSVTQKPWFLAVQMNSDDLWVVSFVWDLLHHGYAWHGFQLARVPSIFPDMLAYAAANAVFHDYRWALFVCQTAEFLAWGYVGARLVTSATEMEFFDAVLAVEAMLAAILLVPDTANVYCVQCDYVDMFQHASPLIVSLAVAGLSVRALERWTVLRCTAIGVLASLAMLSDRLVWAELLIPLLVVLGLVALLSSAMRLRAAALGAIMLAAYGFARAVEGRLNQAPFPVAAFTDLPARLPKTWAQAGALQSGNLLHHEFVIGLSLLVPALLFLGYAPFLIKRGKTEEEEKRRRRAAFLWTYGVLVLACSFCVMLTLGAIRYFASGADLAFAAITLFRLRWTRPLSRALPVATFAIAAWQIAQTGSIVPGTISWRPPLASCVDVLRDRFGAHAGLADYWIARPLSVASRWSVQVDAVRQDGTPNYDMSDRYWYVKSYDDASHPPEYRFIIMNGLDSAAVLARYGRPDHAATCDQAPIWLYDRPIRLASNVSGPLPTSGLR